VKADVVLTGDREMNREGEEWKGVCLAYLLQQSRDFGLSLSQVGRSSPLGPCEPAAFPEQVTAIRCGTKVSSPIVDLSRQFSQEGHGGIALCESQPSLGAAFGRACGVEVALTTSGEPSNFLAPVKRKFAVIQIPVLHEEIDGIDECVTLSDVDVQVRQGGDISDSTDLQVHN
jgi:hypothetical protein